MASKQVDPIGLNVFDVAIEEADGNWLSLNDHSSYTIGGDSFQSSSQQFRKQTVSSPYVDGTYQISARPENATERIVVYVGGDTWQDCQNNIYRLIEAFTQNKYLVRRDIETNRETWTCWTAEYEVQSGRVYVHNRYVPVSLSVPRLPGIVVSERTYE
jgi:hypothetical protein